MPQNQFIRDVQRIFKDKNPPFLFIGSGFSRRHLELDNFEGLLRSTCLPSMDSFRRYYSDASGKLPSTASNIAKDFQKKVWDDDSCKEFITKYSTEFTSSEDSYKFYVSEILKQRHSERKERGFLHSDEIDKIKKATIDAIITTNYDTFLEEIFPDFKVFIGQDELIQNNPQFIGEIYKIHGCVNSPKGIVITDEDYKCFNAKNKYLTSKLLSSFVERPILFIGYSVQDEHIQEIIKSVASCFSNNIERIRGNFIFLKRSHTQENKCTEATLLIDNLLLPYHSIETNNFGIVYEQIASQRKISANLMRIIKEQIYEIALTTKTDKKIKIINPKELEDAVDIEYLIGIGVNNLAEKGYKSINREDLFQDILLNEKGYDSKKLLENTIVRLSKRTKFVPAYKYAKEINKFDIIPEKISILKKDDYASSRNQYEKNYEAINSKTVDGLIRYAMEEKNNIRWALHVIPFLPLDVVKNEINELKNYLKKLLDDNILEDKKTNFGKVVCFYDRVLSDPDFKDN